MLAQQEILSSRGFGLLIRRTGILRRWHLQNDQRVHEMCQIMSFREQSTEITVSSSTAHMPLEVCDMALDKVSDRSAL